MADHSILSEKLEDNEAAAEWGKKQAKLMKKGEEITQRLMEKYTPITLAHCQQESFGRILSSDKEFTCFNYNGHIIRFRTSSKLERYTRIVEWDNGYIVVMAKYEGLPKEEEYIDLISILENLYINPDDFLKNI